ncbi:thiol:disulfide interchange protein DsbC [Kushneria avicenniae]|uniref:Thiol:disulfide interchange protein n=1 Tax=Kushneria avicenniae TaxID=402385 RepID=A0A1I1HSD0_9GAMM|nr:DsbC family protein [Kushneria avicenniae]SFC26824.1 thiol:disulfide interchange protein DsbC [Kushneria avicenniae]
MSMSHAFPFRSLLTGALLAGAVLSQGVQADDADIPKNLGDRLVVNGQKMPVRSVEDSPIPGLYEVQLDNGQTLYSDKDGQYLLVGDLYRNSDGQMVNLTEQKQQQHRVELLKQIPDKDTVVFRPAGEVKAVINVFTDTTCPYCRKFHEEVPELNKRGIEVRYLAFPRAGMEGKGARELSQVWCSDNRSEAMTAAKQGKKLKSRADCDTPIASQFALGKQMAIQGTPALILPDGRMIPGYVPVDRLVGMLGLEN